MALLRTAGIWTFSGALILGQPCAPAQEPASSHRVQRPPSAMAVTHRLPTIETIPVDVASDGLFAGQTELEVNQLVDLIIARNPSVEAMFHAWRAAAQRFPQAIALEDPMFMAMMAPASLHSQDVEAAYVLQGSQKFPWCGKRQARGRAAAAEARAMLGDARNERLQVAQMARTAFYDYFLVQRQLDLTQLNTRAIREFADTARAKYENNQVTEQDVLQADIELADVERRQIELERMRAVSVARINTLLLRIPNEALPPPPKKLELPSEVPPADMLRQLAVGQRPDLAAITARLRAEQAGVTLANKQYYPDADIFGRYDSFWQPVETQSELRGQVGVNMNVPIYHRKLAAGVSEAQFRVAQRRAEYEQKVADIQYEVEVARAQVEESRRIVNLYAAKILPLAERNVSVARSNYDVGTTSFLGLSTALRQFIELREKHQEALADLHRRSAELERVVGGPLPEMADFPREEMPPPR